MYSMYGTHCMYERKLYLELKKLFIDEKLIHFNCRDPFSDNFEAAIRLVLITLTNSTSTNIADVGIHSNIFWNLVRRFRRATLS